MTHRLAKEIHQKFLQLRENCKPKKKKEFGQLDLGLLDLLPEDIKKELRKTGRFGSPHG